MDIIVKRRRPGPQPQSRLAQPSPYDRRWGEWGRVECRHSEDNTVDALLDSGIYLKRVPVASREWVIDGEDAGKDYNSGERDLPPEHARIFVMMPTHTCADCFIAPFSGFSTIDQTKPYMADDKEKIKERITPDEWRGIHDRETGSHELVSPDKKTCVKLDYSKEDHTLDVTLFEKIKLAVVSLKRVLLSVFDDEVKVNHDFGKEITVKTFDTTTTVKQGDITTYSDGNREIDVVGNLKIIVGGDIDIISIGETRINGLVIRLN
jgi:hypothetical protein